MKFLVFNLAVAAALVFLFTADRGDMQKMAAQVHDAAADVKAYARQTLDKSEKILEPGPAKEPVAVKPEPPAAPVKSAPEQAKETPLAPVPPAATPQQPGPPAKTARAIPARPLTPDVAKRRQEVLDGVPPAAPTVSRSATPRLKEGATLMTAGERRKELLTLAEEMELLYARSISR